jgi:hypothetical protein
VDDTKAIESLTREMELTRHEMAALTDSMNRHSFGTQELIVATNRLSDLIIERSKRRGLWQRLVG